MYFPWKWYILYNREKINLIMEKKWLIIGHTDNNDLIFESENWKKTDRLNFVTFSGPENSVTKMRNVTKLSGAKYAKYCWCDGDFKLVECDLRRRGGRLWFNTLKCHNSHLWHIVLIIKILNHSSIDITLFIWYCILLLSLNLFLVEI